MAAEDVTDAAAGDAAAKAGEHASEPASEDTEDVTAPTGAVSLTIISDFI